MKPTSQVSEHIPTSGAPSCTRQAAAGQLGIRSTHQNIVGIYGCSPPTNKDTIYIIPSGYLT